MKVFLKRNFIWKFSWKETLHERFPKKKTLNENFPKKKTLYERFSKKKTHLTSSSNPLPQVSHPILRSNNSFPTQYISIKQSRLDLVEVLNEITFWKKWWEYIAKIWFLNINENQTASYSDVCFIQIKANWAADINHSDYDCVARCPWNVIQKKFRASNFVLLLHSSAHHSALMSFFMYL